MAGLATLRPSSLVNSAIDVVLGLDQVDCVLIVRGGGGRSSSSVCSVSESIWRVSRDSRRWEMVCLR
jgi:hypothetical protein